MLFRSTDIKQLNKIWMVGTGGLIFGIIYYLSSGVLLGFGGKLGTIAFLSTVITIGFFKVINQFIFNKNQLNEFSQIPEKEVL